jgi:hypothetical protein
MSKECLMSRGFKYFARDMNGNLYAYKYKPVKGLGVWSISTIDLEEQYIMINDNRGVYDTVKWEDEEPTEIETLKSAVSQPFVNPIEFGGLSIHNQKGGGTYIIKGDLYKSVLDQNAEKRKERFNELTGEKISEEPADKPNEEPEAGDIYEWRIIREEALWHSLRFIIQNMNDEESEEMDAVVSKTRRRLQTNKDSFDAARYAFHKLSEKESEELIPSSVPQFIHENLSRWVP